MSSREALTTSAAASQAAPTPVEQGPARPRLLFVTQTLPDSLSDGGNVRSFKILEALAQRFLITLVGSTMRADTAGAPDRPLGRLCERVVCVPDVKDGSYSSYVRTSWHVLHGAPPAIAYNYNRGVDAALKQLIRDVSFDRVHLNHTDAGQYLNHFKGTRCVIDTHNLLFDFHHKAADRDSNALRRSAHRIASWQLFRYERAVFEQCERILVCSQRERECLASLGLDDRIAVVPNGVDCDYFRETRTDFLKNPPVVAFTGNMGYRPNHDAALFFARDVLPRLRRAHPDARFLIIGKNPAESVRQLAHRDSGVTVTGQVDDVRAHLRQARLFVAPLRYGSGTRLKLLEAFALGLPSVSTRLGAEGLDCRDGEHVLMADDADGLAFHVGRLLTDPGLHRRIARSARDLVERVYDWGRIGRHLLDVYPA